MALLGTAFAVYEYFNQKRMEEIAAESGGSKGDDFNEGI